MSSELGLDEGQHLREDNEIYGLLLVQCRDSVREESFELPRTPRVGTSSMPVRVHVNETGYDEA